jgi:hypothetical protein
MFIPSAPLEQNRMLAAFPFVSCCSKRTFIEDSCFEKRTLSAENKIQKSIKELRLVQQKSKEKKKTNCTILVN